MALSDNTFQNLADTLTYEVIEYIKADERYAIFMQQIIPECLEKKLGQIEENLKGELSFAIMDRILMVRGRL
jgi:hypothetical protein